MEDISVSVEILIFSHQPPSLALFFWGVSPRCGLLGYLCFSRMEGKATWWPSAGFLVSCEQLWPLLGCVERHSDFKGPYKELSFLKDFLGIWITLSHSSHLLLFSKESWSNTCDGEFYVSIYVGTVLYIWSSFLDVPVEVFLDEMNI